MPGGISASGRAALSGIDLPHVHEENNMFEPVLPNKTLFFCRKI